MTAERTTLRTIVAAERVAFPDDAQPAPGWVAVEGTEIVALGRGVAGDALGPDDGLLELGDRLLTPALVNGHTHLAMGALRGIAIESASRGNLVEELFYRIERHIQPSDVRAFARLGAFESLMQGVGLVWDHYYFGRPLADGLVDVGLAGVVAPTLQDLGGPGKDRWEDELQATLDLAASAPHRQAGVFAALGPHATDTVSDALWARVAELGRAHGLPLHGHVAQTVEELERVAERGGTPLDVLERAGALDVPAFTMAHGIFLGEADLARLDARHTLAWCPWSQSIFAFPAHLPTWQRAGVRWCAASDCAVSNDAMGVLRELRFATTYRTLEATWSGAYGQFLRAPSLEGARAAWTVRQRGHGDEGWLEPRRLLAHGWGVPGSMHPGFRAGVLEVGALANLAVWNPRHPALWPGEDPLRELVMADAGQALEGMMVAGRWVGDVGAGFAASLSESQAYAEARGEAEGRLEALLGRA